MKILPRVILIIIFAVILLAINFLIKFEDGNFSKSLINTVIILLVIFISSKSTGSIIKKRRRY